MQSSEEGDWGGIAAIVYETNVLSKFRHGGAWDAQRIGGVYHSEYRDYASVAIGLYSAAVGIRESESLRLQDAYAELRSNFAPNTTFDATYVHLPEENVRNTDLVSCPRSPSHSAADGGDKQATENKGLVSRFRTTNNVANFGIGTLGYALYQSYTKAEQAR